MRRSGLGWAAANLTTALTAGLTLAACGSGGDANEAAAVPQGSPLSAAELERATVTAADLDGYETEKVPTATSASRRTADPSECAPVVQALGGSSGFTAVARVGRMITTKERGEGGEGEEGGKGAGAGATMILSSHSGEDAVAVLDELRTAAEQCETFKDLSTDFPYENTELQPTSDSGSDSGSDSDYGDESVSVRLTQVIADGEDPIRVPFTVLAVRQGTTVAMFYDFNRPRGAGETEPATIPDEIVRAQLSKLAGASTGPLSSAQVGKELVPGGIGPLLGQQPGGGVQVVAADEVVDLPGE